MATEEVYVDAIGVGQGVSDRLKVKEKRVQCILVGEKPYEETKYKNIKSEVTTDEVIQIEPNVDLK